MTTTTTTTTTNKNSEPASGGVVKVQIPDYDHECDLWPGEDGRLYLVINWSDATISIDSEDSNNRRGYSFAEANLVENSFFLPDNADATALRAWAESDLVPKLQKYFDGYVSDYDDCNNEVGTWPALSDGDRDWRPDHDQSVTMLVGDCPTHYIQIWDAGDFFRPDDMTIAGTLDEFKTRDEITGDALKLLADPDVYLTDLDRAADLLRDDWDEREADTAEALGA